MRPIKAEIRAVAEVLEDSQWETPEQAAEAAIKALDLARASRTLYVAVMQFGETKPWYAGLGPYAGHKAAVAAVNRFPGATEAYKIAVVPLRNDEGLTNLLKEVG